MRNLIIFGVFVLLLIIVQFAQAQTIDEVLDKHVEALGGKEKLATLHSVTMEGVSVMNGNEITNKTMKVQDKLYRNEVNFGMGRMTTLLTAEKGWRTNFRNGGAFEAMTDEVYKSMQHQTDCADPLVNYLAKGHKAELTGKETIDNIECYKIKLTTRGGHEINYWLDAKTSLVYQTSQKGGGFGGPRGGDVELITIYKDYKPVDGILFAFTTELKSTGGGFGGGTMNYEKIEVNKAMDEKLYKPE